MLEMFTEPRGVAVVGASTSPDKLGYQVLHNVIQYGYEGASTRSTQPPQRSWG